MWDKIAASLQSFLGPTGFPIFVLFLFILLTIVGAIALFVIVKLVTGTSKVKLGWFEITAASSPHEDNALKRAIVSSWEKAVTSGEKIGFVIPDDAIAIYGSMWGADSISEEGYRNLENMWSNQRQIDVSDAHITSPLISIIDSKSRILPVLTVRCRHDQVKLLGYFRESKNVTLESH